MSAKRRHWFGMYPGKVVDDADPVAGRGRLRVRVPQVYGAPTEAEYVPDDALPWARPCFPVSDAGCPAVGASVWVMFWGGDPEWPVWLGTWFPDDDIPVEFSSSYGPGPQTRLIRAGGHTIEMRSARNEVHLSLTTPGGMKIDLIDSAALGGPKIHVEAAGGTIELVGAAVTAGDASGTKYRLLDERFVTTFNAHTHPTAATGAPSVPTVPATVTGNATTITKAD